MNAKDSPKEKLPQETDLKKKLSTLADCFQGFEQHIQQKKAKKKENEEKRITDLKSDLVKIDQEIKNEAKRRNDTVHALETLFRDKITTTTRDVEESINEKVENLLVTVAELNKNVDKLAYSIEETSRTFPKMVEERNNELVQQIAEFKAKFESDRNTQNEKMEIIEKIIQEQEYRLNHQLQSERVTRSQKYDDLLQAIENEGRLRKKTGETLHQYLKEQSEVINSSLDNCHKQREQTMEELVSAFVHYTNALQEGVKILAETN